MRHEQFCTEAYSLDLPTAESTSAQTPPRRPSRRRVVCGYGASMRILHTRTQHAVGQGGFHTACIDDGETAFRYAYDCGSMNGNRLAVCIDEVAESADRFDLLFLSHLDQDHANGADKFLDVFATDIAILPYLSPFERLVLVAEASATSGTMTTASAAIAMLESPAAWLFARGVRQVFFVFGPGPGNDPPATRAPSTPPPHDGHLKLDSSRAKQLDPRQTSTHGVKANEIAGVRSLASEPLVIKKGGVAVWELIPFVHPEPLRAPGFRAAVAKLLGFRPPPPDDDPKWLGKLKNLLRDRAKRGNLAKLYQEHIRKDRNLSSMTLYSGAVASPSAKILVSGWRRQHHMMAAQLAWMGTGDAHLDRINRRAAFEQFYSQVLGNVGTMTLPHHGSRHNLATAFIRERPLRAWVAAYGTDNTYHHPDRHLMNAANSYGDGVHVTEQPQTEYTESFVLDI